jgi:sugar (glycoside-pentoside-hexuronide) transporter
VPADQRLTVTEKIGYGFGDLASNLFWQMFSIFIAKYYTDVFLLGAATMGTMLLVTRLGDAIVDPVIGAIADRTHTRWGYFRPYLVWMALPMALTAVATFTVPGYGGTARVVYAYVTLSLMMVAYSAINIPYSALLGVLTPSSQERTSASSYRFVMALLPVFVIVNTALPMAQHFGGDVNSPRGWQVTMAIYAAVAVVLYLATFAMTKERVQPEVGQKTTLANDVKDLFANRPWVVLCVVGIAALTYANIRGTVAIYYFENVVPGGKDWFGPVMTTGAVAFIAGVMVTSPLAKRFGKRNFYMVSMALTAVLTAGFYFVPPSNLPLVWAAHALISLCAAPTAPLVWAMYADTADYSEWRCGRRATGLIFSAASFAQKFGWAIGGAGTGWLLAWFGYQPNVAQSARTIDGLMLMMSIIPTVGALIAIAALWFYELDEDTVTTMGNELAARRALPAAAATAAQTVGAVAASAQPATADAAAPPPVPTRLDQEPAMPAPTNHPHAEPVAAPAAARAPSAPDVPAWPVGPGAAVVALARTGTGTDGSASISPPPPALMPQARATLATEFRAVLDAGVHGLCFSPYLPGQGPGSTISAAQIRERLALVKPHTGWVRTFSCTDGHEQTPRIARELGLKTMVGAWLGRDAAINAREIANAIAVAQAGDADIVAIGNEVLLREDMTEDELLAAIQQVQQALPGVPVGTVDAYYLFERHPRITAACDVILANCYPFWQGCPREQAVAYMASMVARTQSVAGGKPVVISETGWPDQGSAFHGAVPSVEGAMRNFIDTQRWATEQGIAVFHFAAFDEAWKVDAEGDVGAYWGLWDSEGRPKFTA